MSSNETFKLVDQVPVNPPIKPPWCLLDHPEIWDKTNFTVLNDNGTELLSDVVSRSKRLRDLSKSPKNGITRIPSKSVIKRFLTCSICNEIPFLRKGNPNKKMGNGDPYPSTVYHCSVGHSVCRSCAQSFETCMFEIPYGEAQVTKVDAVVECEMSLTTWNNVNLCHASIEFGPYDFFLADVVEDTVFRCGYYYDGCGFKGRGKLLRDHEEGHVESGGELEDTGDEGHTRESDDDAAILGYNHCEAVANADRIIGGVLGSINRSQIDLSGVPRSILQKHLKDESLSGGGRKRCN